MAHGSTHLDDQGESPLSLRILTKTTCLGDFEAKPKELPGRSRTSIGLILGMARGALFSSSGLGLSCARTARIDDVNLCGLPVGLPRALVAALLCLVSSL